MREIEVSAKTVDEAIKSALEQLEMDKDQVEVVVLKKGRSGVLGMGSEDAVVKVKPKEKPLAKPENNDDMIVVAREVLDRLIESMGLSAEVAVMHDEDNSSPVTMDISGEDLGILIGRRGQTLAALQYIIRLIVAEKMKMWVPLNVDVAGYKKRRYEALRGLALRLAEQVKRNQRMLALEPMPSDERRVINITLANHPDITTQSVGEGGVRKVVIQLKKR